MPARTSLSPVAHDGCVASQDLTTAGELNTEPKP